MSGRTLHLFFSHTLTLEQERDARERLGVVRFAPLPPDLQKLWSNIPPELERLEVYLEPLIRYARECVRVGDAALIQGDFGATCAMVALVRSLGATPIYATTKREAKERIVDGKIERRSYFRHVRFRVYE